LLTYADNTAIGFFRKQGFEPVLETPLCSWNGYIKIYLEGTLMECKIFPGLSYTRFSAILRDNKSGILARIKAIPVFRFNSDIL
jgi:histone acetyltransferase